MSQLSILQKWTIEEEIDELVAALPDYVNLKLQDSHQTLTFKVFVQDGPYKDHELEFLARIPNSYKFEVILQILTVIYLKLCLIFNVAAPHDMLYA